MQYVPLIVYLLSVIYMLAVVRNYTRPNSRLYCPSHKDKLVLAIYDTIAVVIAIAFTVGMMYLGHLSLELAFGVKP